MFLFLHQGKHAFYVDGEHAFLYTLYRFHSPATRQSEDTVFWCYDYTVLSKMFNRVVEWLDETHGHRLRSLQHIAHKLPLFNEAIVDKLKKEFPGGGVAANPPEAEHCALFGDGSRFEVSFLICESILPCLISLLIGM